MRAALRALTRRPGWWGRPSRSGQPSPWRPRRGTPGAPAPATGRRRCRCRGQGRTAPCAPGSGLGAMGAVRSRRHAGPRRRRPPRHGSRPPPTRSASTRCSRCRKFSGASVARAVSQESTASSSDNSAGRSPGAAARASSARLNARRTCATALGYDGPTYFSRGIAAAECLASSAGSVQHGGDESLGHVRDRRRQRIARDRTRPPRRPGWRLGRHDARLAAQYPDQATVGREHLRSVVVPGAPGELQCGFDLGDVAVRANPHSRATRIPPGSRSSTRSAGRHRGQGPPVRAGPASCPPRSARTIGPCRGRTGIGPGTSVVRIRGPRPRRVSAASADNRCGSPAAAGSSRTRCGQPGRRESGLGRVRPTSSTLPGSTSSSWTGR